MLEEDKFHLENILVHEFGAPYLARRMSVAKPRDLFLVPLSRSQPQTWLRCPMLCRSQHHGPCAGRPALVR
jgi:hypothetical protein